MATFTEAFAWMSERPGNEATDEVGTTWKISDKDSANFMGLEPGQATWQSKSMSLKRMRSEGWTINRRWPVERVEQFVSFSSTRNGFSRLCGERGFNVNLDIHAPEGHEFPSGKVYRLTLEPADAAHPAPPDPAPVPLTPGHAASCDCPDCILALCDERYCEPDAPPAVASGERSPAPRKGRKAVDELSVCNILEHLKAMGYAGLSSMAVRHILTRAFDLGVFDEAVRAAVLAEVCRDLTEEEALRFVGGHPGAHRMTTHEIVSLVHKADAIRSRGLRPGGGAT